MGRTHACSERGRLSTEPAAGFEVAPWSIDVDAGTGIGKGRDSVWRVIGKGPHCDSFGSSSRGAPTGICCAIPSRHNDSNPHVDRCIHQGVQGIVFSLAFNRIGSHTHVHDHVGTDCACLLHLHDIIQSLSGPSSIAKAITAENLHVMHSNLLGDSIGSSSSNASYIVGGEVLESIHI